MVTRTITNLGRIWRHLQGLSQPNGQSCHYQRLCCGLRKRGTVMAAKGVPDLPLRRVPEQAAMDLIEETLGELSILDLPVDPIYIAAELGIQVFTSELRSNVSGALVRNENASPAIFLNRDDAPNRQRFSCAHELGHFVHRGRQDAGPIEYVDFRGPLASSGTDADERFANQFAAALLMPRLLVEQLAESMSVSALAMEFGVSVDAMNYRLINLGLR